MNKNKKITILIGNQPSSRITLCYPECKMLPSEYIPIVAKHMVELDDDIVIQTCSENIVNFIGSLIDFDILNNENCKVVMGGKSYTFDVDGVMPSDWPWGILGWHDEVKVKNILLGE